jgi:sugar phosphate isomerase/epimerase
MKLGIGTYTYMWSIGFEGARPARPLGALDLLAKARELDVRVVQYGPNLSLNTLSEGELARLVETAYLWELELEVGTRGLGTEHLRREIDLTRRAGATLLRTVPEEGDDLESSLRAIAPVLAERHVRLAIENSKIPAARLAQALRDVRSPWIGITLDTVNSLAIPEGTEQVARALAPYTFCLHVKDFAAERAWHMMGFQVQGRPAGQGQLNVPWLLNLLREAGASGNAILELWPPEQATLEETIALEQSWAVESITYLRKHISD